MIKDLSLLLLSLFLIFILIFFREQLALKNNLKTNKSPFGESYLFIKMPAVASVPKNLYLCTSLKDLNKKTEIKPDKTSTKRYAYLNIVTLFPRNKVLIGTGMQR